MVKLYSEYKIEFWNALKAEDFETMDRLFEEQPRLRQHKPIGGGSWLYYAAGKESLEAVKYFLSRGFDVNEVSEYFEDNVLNTACSEGTIEIIEFLLENDAKIDVSEGHTNPLISAINSGAGLLGEGINGIVNRDKVIKLLLNRGIDPWIEYTNSVMYRQNAAGFALLNGVPELATIIIDHSSNGDESLRHTFKEKAKAAYYRQVKLHWLPEWLRRKVVR